jgi:alpha-beta hydrolase superfamily lysophospholipase
MPTPHHESVRIPLPDGELAGDVSFSQSKTDFALVWVHGFGSHRGGEKAQALRAACARRGWAFAAFDFRGHGQSSGTLTDLRASGLLDDLETVRVYLAQRGIHRLGLVGSSMGGWAVCWYALRMERNVVPACVLLAPAFRFMQARWEQLTEEERTRWKETGRLAVRSDWVQGEIGYGLAEERELFPAGQLAARWDRPLLIFHGVRDAVVPYSHSLAFVELTAFPDVELRMFKDGDHRLTSRKDEIAEEACRFFEKFEQ